MTTNQLPRLVRRLARDIRPGDTLTDSEGRRMRDVYDVDHVSNVHGKVIIRTGRSGSGSTVCSPDAQLWIVEG